MSENKFISDTSFPENLSIMLFALIAILGMLGYFGLVPNIAFSFFQTPWAEIITLLLALLGLLGVLGVLTSSAPLQLSGSIAPIAMIGMGIGLTVNRLLVQFIFDAFLIQAVISILIGLVSLISIFLSYKNQQEMKWRVSTGLEDEKSRYALQVDDLAKDYEMGPTNIVHALRGVSLKIKKGEFVSIMGPSGCGKSTLLNLMGALDTPTRGKVYVDGVDLTTLSDAQLSTVRGKKIGFIFQSYNLVNRTDVVSNITLPTVTHGTRNPEKRAHELLRIVGLPDKADRKPKMLSGGEQQRVSIARSLINNPTIILADEPTGNLDSKMGTQVMSFLRELNQDLGVSIVAVTHSREIAEMTDKIYMLRDGKIVKIEETTHIGAWT